MHIVYFSHSSADSVFLNPRTLESNKIVDSNKYMKKRSDNHLLDTIIICRVKYSLSFIKLVNIHWKKKENRDQYNEKFFFTRIRTLLEVRVGMNRNKW